jgi:hypothetical protein
VVSTGSTDGSWRPRLVALDIDGTLCSTNRPIIALLETHQQEDGSVRVPEALRPYLGGLEVLKPFETVAARPPQEPPVTA